MIGAVGGGWLADRFHEYVLVGMHALAAVSITLLGCYGAPMELLFLLVGRAGASTIGTQSWPIPAMLFALLRRGSMAAHQRRGNGARLGSCGAAAMPACAPSPSLGPVEADESVNGRTCGAPRPATTEPGPAVVLVRPLGDGLDGTSIGPDHGDETCKSEDVDDDCDHEQDIVVDCE